jgi:hypothetical protein
MHFLSYSTCRFNQSRRLSLQFHFNFHLKIQDWIPLRPTSASSEFHYSCKYQFSVVHHNNQVVWDLYYLMINSMQQYKDSQIIMCWQQLQFFVASIRSPHGKLFCNSVNSSSSNICRYKGLQIGGISYM